MQFRIILGQFAACSLSLFATLVLVAAAYIPPTGDLFVAATGTTVARDTCKPQAHRPDRPNHCAPRDGQLA